jgi:hypothetical protein
MKILLPPFIDQIIETEDDIPTAMSAFNFIRKSQNVRSIETPFVPPLLATGLIINHCMPPKVKTPLNCGVV